MQCQALWLVRLLGYWLAWLEVADVLPHLLIGPPLTFCLGNKGIPVIGRISLSQHALKDAIDIRFCAISPLGGLVIDPGQNDHPAVLVEAEEQSVLLEKLWRVASACALDLALNLAEIWYRRDSLESPPA